MKIRSLIIIPLCCTLFGCSIFNAPISLMKQLLPLAIQYAPYALMLLEESGDTRLASLQDKEQFQNYLHSSLQTPHYLPELASLLDEKLPERSSRLQEIHLIRLKTPEDIQKVEQLFDQLAKRGKVHCFVTHHNLRDQEQRGKVSHSLAQENCSIYATGEIKAYLR